LSYPIGIDTIHLRPTPRLAHTEYVDSAPLIQAVTGEVGCHSATRRFNDAWEIDLIWSTNDGPIPWAERGRATDMGHAEFIAGGGDRREVKPCPFHSPEEVWAFDAVAEYGLPDFDALVDYYQSFYAEKQAENPHQVYTGGYYKTIISGAIEACCWRRLTPTGLRRCSIRSTASACTTSRPGQRLPSKFLFVTMIWCGARGLSSARHFTGR
jgi:hypothetical protein